MKWMDRHVVLWSVCSKAWYSLFLKTVNCSPEINNLYLGAVVVNVHGIITRVLKRSLLRLS